VLIRHDKVRAAALALLALGAVLSGVAWQTRAELESAKRLTERLKGDLAAAANSAGAAVATPPAPDFALGLPATAPVEATIRRIQRASSAHGVAFVSANVNSREPTPSTLGRTELALTLRGSYPQLKAVLAEGANGPGIVMQRLSLRRQASPTELEALAGFVLLTRPSLDVRK
jgi:Type II secretion system (T2SS), protein M subtype b